jgi:hypothetical protein
MLETGALTSRLALSRALWVVLVAHPASDGETLLQAEGDDGTYVLAFTSEDKADRARQAFGCENRSRLLCVPVDLHVELFGAICQVDACGIMLDLEPGSRRYLWLSRLVQRS